MIVIRLYVEGLMAKKLTLSVDEELIRFAHQYSEETQQSISEIFEKYLSRLQGEINVTNLSKEAQSLYGVLEGTVLPDKKDLRKAFHEKSIT